MKQITLLIFMLLAVFANSQTTLQSVHPFKNGEKLSYIASYNMKGLMTELAGIDMEVTDVSGKKKPIYKLKFTANTLTSWDDYVKVRHAYQTYVEASTLKPLIMAQDSDVKGIKTDAKYSFKHKTGIAEVTGTKDNGKPINLKIPIDNNSFDIVSLLYMARTLNYNNLKIGESKPFKALALERSIPISIKYMGKENINVKGMGSKECYKLGLVLKNKFVVEPDVTYLWITTDKNRVPVLISTVYKEGKALIKLNNFEGLQYN
ncbi:MAG: DUF3108 domain-containing protein [Salinivirgaceae bacterium]|nr:DUF3108 domain-containing protein [Salinivirgaceae bacterium]